MYGPRFAPLVATLLAAALAAGCAGPPARPGAASSAPFPADAYRAPATDGTVYRLDPAASSLRILVYRGGPLAGRGHNHVIEADGFRGLVFLPDEGLDEARLDLAVPVGGMVVDRPAARSAAHGAFAQPLDEEARAGTRANMLGPRVLDARRFPRITVHAEDVRGALPWPVIRAAVTLHGRTRRLTVPVEVRTGTDGLTATGSLVLRQSDFGITPITAMGGLLRVQDTVTVVFRLVGQPRRAGGLSLDAVDTAAGRSDPETRTGPGGQAHRRRDRGHTPVDTVAPRSSRPATTSHTLSTAGTAARRTGPAVTAR